eukprot:1147628-Lingulodinium_polyedra.AAC.1
MPRHAKTLTRVAMLAQSCTRPQRAVIASASFCRAWVARVAQGRGIARGWNCALRWAVGPAPIGSRADICLWFARRVGWTICVVVC